MISIKLNTRFLNEINKNQFILNTYISRNQHPKNILIMYKYFSESKHLKTWLFARIKDYFFIKKTEI